MSVSMPSRADMVMMQLMALAKPIFGARDFGFAVDCASDRILVSYGPRPYQTAVAATAEELDNCNLEPFLGRMRRLAGIEKTDRVEIEETGAEKLAHMRHHVRTLEL